MKFPRHILFAAILAAVSCSTHNVADGFDDVRYRPGFAEGFEIIGIQDSLSSVIRVKAAWQGADSSAFDLFISRNGETPPEGFDGQTVNGPARRIVAMSSKQKGNVLPGVAIATALMPPLCTAGFGLATGNFYYFFGAFYLFFINSVFIAFATTLGVKLMKYSKKEFVDDERRKKVERIVYTILILTMAPSIYLTYNMVKENFFEVAAARFVSQNFNYPDTQVLSKSAEIEHGKRIIRVSLVGAEIPQDSIAVAQARLPQYGLGGAVLEVRQGYGSNSMDMTTLSSTMFKDIYLHNQEQITRQQQVIDSLENVTSHYQQYDSVGISVAPEIKVLFPNVTDIAISKTIFSSIETDVRDTTTLAVVRYSRAFSATEQKQFQEWLQARLGAKKVQLVLEH